MLVSFNNCNIPKISHNSTSSEEIDKIHKIVLYLISDNIAVLVQTDKYGAIDKTDITAMGYCVIKFMS